MLGLHIIKSDNSTLEESVNLLIKNNNLNIKSVQIFTHGPRFVSELKLDYKTISQITKLVYLSIHSAYPLISIWNVNKDNCNLPSSKMQINNLNSQLEACVNTKADSLVIHLKKIKAKKVADSMLYFKNIIKKHKILLLLEMIACKPDPDLSYETPEKIDNLTTLIGYEEKWWGWCIDTAHLWSSGIDIKSYDNMSKWLEQIIYKKKIKMFHLNGSSVLMGSGKDKHAPPFSKMDKIWHNVDPKKSGVYAVCKFALKYNIPIICELSNFSLLEQFNSLKVVNKLLNY
jgi:deoxyribonuclease-4